MFSSTRSLIVPILLLTSSVHAQITFRRRRTPIGRIIAGCVIGGLAGIFFLCLFMMLLRRRRLARRTLVNVDGQHRPPPQKAMFGGFWNQNNRNNGTYSNQTFANGSAGDPQQQSAQNGVSPYGQQAPYSPYPNTNTSAPPPTYDNDKQANYAPPPVSSYGANGAQHHFVPPLGAPPPVHTTGQDPSFIGGFRH